MTRAIPNFFNDKDRAYFDTAEEILIVADADGPAERPWISGEVDVIDKIEIKTAHLLEKRTRQSRSSMSAGHPALHLPHATRGTAPFDDNKVRMALKHAIDREDSPAEGPARLRDTSATTTRSRRPIRYFNSGTARPAHLRSGQGQVHMPRRPDMEGLKVATQRGRCRLERRHRRGGALSRSRPPSAGIDLVAKWCACPTTATGPTSG